jgi:ribonuclease VapC
LNPVVLDSSAILALLQNEPGANIVASQLGNAMISAVNMAEVMSKLSDEQFNEEQLSAILGDLKLDVIPFDPSQAMSSGMLRSKTRHMGLSLGDRACLALAILKTATVLTTDRVWANLDIGLKIEVIR